MWTFSIGRDEEFPGAWKRSIRNTLSYFSLSNFRERFGIRNIFRRLPLNGADELAYEMRAPAHSCADVTCVRLPDAKGETCVRPSNKESETGSSPKQE